MGRTVEPSMNAGDKRGSTFGGTLTVALIAFTIMYAAGSYLEQTSKDSIITGGDKYFILYSKKKLFL
jgi:hypothetical protein